MTVSYSVTLKSTRMNAVITAIDAQTGVGYMEIGTAGMGAVLIQINLQKPSFTQNSGVITMVGAQGGTAGATGTAAAARIKDGAGTVQVSGLTVGTSGTDVVLSSVAITSGDPVT